MGVILSKICLHEFSLCRIEIYLLKIECLFEMFSQIMHVHNIHLLKLQLYDYHNYCSWQQILSPKDLSNCKLRDQIMTTTFALVWKHPDFRCQTSLISNGFMRWQNYPHFPISPTYIINIIHLDCFLDSVVTLAKSNRKHLISMKIFWQIILWLTRVKQLIAVP